MTITETWLRGDERDNMKIADFRNSLPDFQIISAPRIGRTGGGVCTLLRKGFSVTKHTDKSFQSFEHMDLSVSSSLKTVRLVTIYRPPKPKKNKEPVSKFFSEFSNLLETVSIGMTPVVFTGDFNLHMNDMNDKDARDFRDLLDSADLLQHVTEPTHSDGNTLDLVISSKSDNIISNVTVYNCLPPRHQAVTCRLDISRPETSKHTFIVRNYRGIDFDKFTADILKSSLYSNLNSDDNLDHLAEQYDTILRDIVDKHAPEETREITLRPNAPWFSPELQAAKQKKRQSERAFVKSGLESHRLAFHDQRKEYHKLLRDAKRDYHKSQVERCRDRQLFNVIDKISVGKSDQVLPTSESDKDLADNFANYFSSRILDLRQQLENVSDESTVISQDSCRSSFGAFNQVTEEDVRKFILQSPTKSCQLDPIPTWMLKEQLLTVLTPVITRLINKSFADGKFPSLFKRARVVPLLKKNNSGSRSVKKLPSHF